MKQNTNNQTKYKQTNKIQQSNQIQTIKPNTNNQTKYKQTNKNTKTTKQLCKMYIDAMNE